MNRAASKSIQIVAATPERWPQVVELFGPRGACGGCWCMYWRRSRSEYERHKGTGNRRALRLLVQRGDPPPGVLALAGDRPVGWCAVAPREEYGSLQRSRILKPVDERRVWSVVCFFVRKDQRGRGLSRELLRGAVRLAAAHGARIVEGYPIEPAKDSLPDVFAFPGLAATFKAAGFREVARRSPTRPIFRKQVRPARTTGTRSR